VVTNGPRGPARSAALDGRRAVQDYIIAELEAMDAASSPSTTKKGQKAWRKRRAFLVEQLRIASGAHPRNAKPDAELVKARREVERLKAAVQEASRGGAPRALRRRHDLAAGEARSFEAQERGDHKARREEAKRYHARARAQYEASVRWRKGVMKGNADLRKARLERAEGTAARIRSAFAMEDPATSGRLPWRPLPPGELTREGVGEHYRKLAREHPNRRYVLQRIDKAFALGPSRWWEGLDGFGGYVVFGYPGTDKVLLECAIYGNAIYVLGPDWQRLSRLSKQEAMKDPSSRRIAHRGGGSRPSRRSWAYGEGKPRYCCGYNGPSTKAWQPPTKRSRRPYSPGTSSATDRTFPGRPSKSSNREKGTRSAASAGDVVGRRGLS
jgi:hypothetical protein